MVCQNWNYIKQLKNTGAESAMKFFGRGYLVNTYLELC